MCLENLSAEKIDITTRKENLDKKECALKAAISVLPDNQRDIDELITESENTIKEIEEIKARYEVKIKELEYNNDMMVHMVDMLEVREGVASDESSHDTSKGSKSVILRDFALNSSLEESFNLASVSMQNFVQKADVLTDSTNSKSNEESSTDESNNTSVIIDQKAIQESLIKLAANGETDLQFMDVVAITMDEKGAKEIDSKSSIRGNDLVKLFNGSAKQTGSDETNSEDNVGAVVEKKGRKRRRSSKPKPKAVTE